MTETHTAATFRRFPMGPKLREYLALGETYAGETEPLRDKSIEGDLVDFLSDFHLHNMDRLTARDVTDLLDELVTMDLPEAALDLARRRPEALADNDFRSQLGIGIAAMITGDLELSERALRKAQATLPEEPAPYVNLAQIFQQQGRQDEAEVWCLAGLDAEPNNLRLWDLVAGLYHKRFGEYLGDELRRLADQRNSWAGLSLACELTTTGDRYFKATLLERIYSQGERDPQFLIELTGAYGISEQLDKIPALVWQAERVATTPLPWQLHVHCAQAQLGLGQNAAALEALEKAEKDTLMPAAVRASLGELKSEAAAPVTHH